MARYTNKTFTSSGTWTCPAGVTTVIVMGCGGGGGGGGGSTTEGGLGGYGSGSRMVFLDVVPNTSYTITIGAGGAGGVGYSSGGAGGDTSFGALEMFYGAYYGGRGSVLGNAYGLLVAYQRPYYLTVNDGGVCTLDTNTATTSYSGSINGWRTGEHGDLTAGLNAGGGGGAGGYANGGDGGADETNGADAPANSGAGGGGSGESAAGNRDGGDGGSGYMEIIWLE